MTYIYILEQNGIPFYVGKAKNIVRRRHGHYRNYGTDIDLVIIDECGDDVLLWKPLESYWIEQFRQWGFELQNKNKGGGGPSFYTEESKLKMRNPRKEGTGAKISKALIEGNHSKYYTQEIRDKMSTHAKGSHGGPFTDIHIANIKLSRRLTSKRVLQYNLQGKLLKKWDSKGEAAEFIKNKLNLSSNVVSQIKDCILGRQKTSFKYIWRYEGIERELDTFNIIYQFDLHKKLIGEFKSHGILKEWIKQNTKVEYNTVSSSIVKHSKDRTYKSQNLYYSINKTI